MIRILRKTRSGTKPGTVQYLPRHVSMQDYSQDDLDAIAAELNGRPRQTLGFKTPSEALAEALR
jgi:IS30 family transposase